VGGDGVWIADAGRVAPSFRGALAALSPSSYTHALDGTQRHTTPHPPSIYTLIVSHLMTYDSDSLSMVFFYLMKSRSNSPASGASDPSQPWRISIGVPWHL
jgi:hypothetical protein